MDDYAAGIQRLGAQFLPFLAAVVAHEFGHGFAARAWGDHTAEEHGRLTLNPVPHIDPIGTLLFPIINMFSGMGFLIGWARPVPIDPRRFRNYRKGLFTVAFAGPLANFILAFVSALALCLMVRFVSRDFYFYKEFAMMLEVGVFINFALGFFNLIPLPPLDGSKMVESFLSYTAAQKYEQLSRYSFLILMALLFTGALRFMAGPIVFMATVTLNIAAWLTGISLM